MNNMLDSISKPTLLLDSERAQRNLDHLLRKTTEQKIILRPHFKTHQSHLIGRWFRDVGIDRITVSSIDMAEYFAADGWQDITIAFPVNTRQLPQIQTLSEQCKLGLIVLDPGTVQILGENLKHPVDLWIKIDVGTHRTGLLPEAHGQIQSILDAIQQFNQLHFSGFIAHAGHTYQARSAGAVQVIYNQTLQQLTALRIQYQSHFPDLKISVGDTPSASVVDEFGAVDEIRPGNFIFYDLMQEQIGACAFDDIAVAMACPVVAVHPDRLQWIIYGGAVHFSKEFIVLENGNKCFGRMVNPAGNSWTTDNASQNPYLISLSQEHGVVQCTPATFNLYKPGDLSLWLPVHSCLVADAVAQYFSVEGRLVDHFRTCKS